MRVVPFEFTSNGGRGVALSRRVKVAIATFYEVIKIDDSVKMETRDIEVKAKIRTKKIEQSHWR